jgi:2-keto-4-pentenoate hydratase/2-oxohepta-3-ene-1,7-dioic acid hydratase in catechol pathway
MKLLTYRKGNGYGLGALVGQRVLDVNKALNTRLDMLRLLDQGEEAMGRVADAVRSAEDRSRAGKNDGLLALKDLRLAAPIPRTRKNIVCLGLNYAEHVKEGGKDRDLPPHPIFFTKPPTAITGPYDPVVYGRAVDRLDYEVELAFVIGTEGKYISKDEALDHVAGYMVFQDISERTLQRQHQQWFRGKSLDTFAPMGPYLVTRDEVPDPQGLDLWCKVNDATRQKSNTGNMIFDVRTIISTLSDGITLEPGDVFATGTPSGVGASHPLGLLKVGDVIESGVERLGTMRNEVVAEKRP